MEINYYKNKICLNVLAKNIKNAKEIYEAAEKYVLVGVLSSNYKNYESAILDMQNYMDILDKNLSVGLGNGNPAQWKMVSNIAKEIKANHFNQIFSAVGHTRANVSNETSHINALISPTGIPKMVKISTGPLSQNCEIPAIINIDTAISMIKEMGGNSVKFFPLNGLKHKEELIEVAKSCAKNNFILEPTGGIDLNNFEEIINIILDTGIEKIIPHVYSSIINKETGETNIEDIHKLMNIIKKII